MADEQKPRNAWDANALLTDVQRRVCFAQHQSRLVANWFIMRQGRNSTVRSTRWRPWHCTLGNTILCCAVSQCPTLVVTLTLSARPLSAPLSAPAIARMCAVAVAVTAQAFRRCEPLASRIVALDCYAACPTCGRRNIVVYVGRGRSPRR
jgi:hypothetical protein